jgi:hypothetical protein
MAVRVHAFIAVGITAVLVAGCSIFSFGRNKDREPEPPAPLAAAPVETVTGVALPPPDTSQPASGLAALDPSLQTGTVTPAPTTAPAAIGGSEIGRTDLLGGWTINSAGETCQLFMTLTTWAGGYRASTRGCTSPPLQTVSAWNMEAGQVQLLNDAGATIARLHPASKTQFSGQTEGGGPITVSR